MPASPAMRFSPGRESRADNHKRGRSLENGVVFKERDDDLALFNEVQTREQDNFLLQSNDDFEDTFVTKLRDFSDHKLGINIAARGESSDFLNTEEEKNDYEWLITPPDTPLFSSLDDETPQVILPQRGRPRAQPISLSRSSTMEKHQRSSRSSPSPNRLTPSPQSSNITFQPPTRSKRPSSPSSKPSTPPPASRRLSTGSSSITTKGISGISPVKTTRGNSASPKIRAWQANIPGFSTEAPPNLRTSLADRPASYVRGSSPASRSSRQSMSPTPRSISSSHSHDRDRFSPRSKGSIASSADDDVEIESLPSVFVVDVSQRLNSRKLGGFQNNSHNNNKASFSQKTNRTVSSISAPKRSFDMALRQMDNKRVPQNMFRPLLTSVPSSTFYAGKSAPVWNSSVTTSSNASSDLPTTYAHEIQETQLNDDEATSGSCVKLQDSSSSSFVDDQVFISEKTDSLTEDMTNETHEISPTLQLGDLKDGVENLADCDTEMCVVLDDDFKETEVETLKDMLLCSRCGCRYSDDFIQSEKEIKLCENCQNSYPSLKPQAEEVNISDEDHESFNTMKPQMNPVLEVEVESLELTPFELHEDVVKEATEVNHEVISQPSYTDAVDFSDSKVEDSLVLKKSNSMKGIVVRSGNFSASSISLDDLSYVRYYSTNTNSMRSSLGRGSLSASSSFDFGQTTNTHTDTRLNRNKKQHQRSVSSFSGSSSHAFHPSSVGTSTLDSFEVSSVHVVKDVADVASITCPQETTPCENDTWTENEDVDNQTGHECSNVEESEEEEDKGVSVCVAEVEVELSVISEGEIDQSCASPPVSQCNVSAMDDDNIESESESEPEPEPESESLVLIEDEGKTKGRRLTLEEATETILFCSSIVHNIAYEAATLAIQKQHSDASQTENNNTSSSGQLIPSIGKPTKEIQTKKTKKTSSKSQKNRNKKVTTTKPPNNNNTNTDEESDLVKPRIVYPNNKENRRPPKLESKCNCSIM
ncbi:hypothetical protein Lser_V15G41005 [Lactuca serriola]